METTKLSDDYIKSLGLDAEALNPLEMNKIHFETGVHSDIADNA